MYAKNYIISYSIFIEHPLFAKHSSHIENTIINKTKSLPSENLTFLMKRDIIIIIQGNSFNFEPLESNVLLIFVTLSIVNVL